MIPEEEAPDRRFQRLVDYVQQGVAVGDLTPGDRLPSERELVRQFGIGRASVREALRVLENVGLVKSQPRDPRGPLIQAPTPEPIRRSLTILTSAGGVNLAHLIQVRMIMEASANLVAAAARSQEHLLALEENLERMSERVETGAGDFSVIDLEFHELVARSGGNPLIHVYGEVTREAIVNLIERTIQAAGDDKEVMRRTLDHHRAVYAAIAAGNGLLASRLAREALYSHYSHLVSDRERAVLADLVRECGGEVAT